MCTSCEQSSASLTSSGISLPSGAQGLAGCKDESRGSSRSLVSFSVQVTTMGHPVVLSVLPWHEKRCIRDYIILEDEPATQSGERLHFFFHSRYTALFPKKKLPVSQFSCVMFLYCFAEHLLWTNIKILSSAEILLPGGFVLLVSASVRTINPL